MAFEDNIIKNVKLFFSQGFTEVYNQGKRIDQKNLYISKQWDFGIYDLLDVYDAELSEEVDFIPYCDLEDITLKSCDLDLSFPFRYYFPNCMKNDFAPRNRL